MRLQLIDEHAHKARIGSIWSFFDRHGISFKKSLRAAEQDPPDVAAARASWADDQTAWSSSTRPARAPTWRGCATRGERLDRKGSARSLEDNDIRCRSGGDWPHGAVRHRRPDGRRYLPRLPRTAP